MNHFHIVWSIFTSIQIFSLIHCYLSTTPAPILSWVYFNTPATLFNTSGSVAVLWLTPTLATINKRKWSLKKRKNQPKLNANAEALRNLFIFKARLVCANHFFLINHTPKLFWHSNLNEPQRKNFVLIIIQLAEVEIQQSSEFFELLWFKCLVYSFTWLISKSLSLISFQNSAPIFLNLGIFK